MTYEYVTVNKVSRADGYPLPKIEEIHNKLSGGKTFTELDLSHAYEQMILDDASEELVTINTHRGLYYYNRLPYGVHIVCTWNFPKNDGKFTKWDSTYWRSIR